MTARRNSASSWALVSHKQLDIGAGSRVPVQPGHMPGLNQLHVDHARWHLHAQGNPVTQMLIQVQGVGV